MIEVKDRIPTYPGRVKLIPVAGQANTYDLVRADEPIEEGTPINRALFQSLTEDISALLQQVNDRLFEMSQRVRVGDLVDGSVFGLYENGVLVPFIKLTNNYENTGRILVVRKDCVTSDYLTNTTDAKYENSRCDSWLNNQYISQLDVATKSVLAAVNIGVGSGNYGVVTVSRKVFLLSLSEYGIDITSVGITNIGSALPYFSTAARRVAKLNGASVNHWTRSTNTASSNATYVTTSGSYTVTQAHNSFVAGIRPALTLPVDFEVTVGVPSTSNVMATAEVL